MNEIYSYIYKALIISSVIAFLLGFVVGMSDNIKVQIGSYIAGYSVLSLGIFLLIFILLNNVNKILQTKEKISYGLMILGPFVIMICVIIFILFMLIKYKENIIENRIAPGYNSFMNIIIILLFIQTYLVYSNINTERFETSHKLSGIINGFMYLLSTLMGISSIILYIILKYYSTDGFTCLNK